MLEAWRGGAFDGHTDINPGDTLNPGDLGSTLAVGSGVPRLLEMMTMRGRLSVPRPEVRPLLIHSALKPFRASRAPHPLVGPRLQLETIPRQKKMQRSKIWRPGTPNSSPLFWGATSSSVER